MRVRRAVVAAVLPLLLVAACSEGEDEDKKASGKSCDNLLQSANAAANLPAGIPAGVTGATFYDVQTQGATKRYFAYVTGEDIVKTRDDVKAAFESGGYQIEGVDQEEGAEAEFEWTKGGDEGSVQVIPLCQGHLRIRWRVGPK